MYFNQSVFLLFCKPGVKLSLLVGDDIIDAVCFGIHESPDGRVHLETPEAQLQSFDRKIDRYYDTLEQEAAQRAAERKAKNRQRDSYER